MKLCKFPDGRYVVVDKIVGIIPKHTVDTQNKIITKGSCLRLEGGSEWLFEESVESLIGFIRTQTKDIFSIT